VTGPHPFDVCGPLPSGVTVLEASAGTGKTFTIAALAARYVAEGTPLDDMLLVTFGRMATGELRARVRERLVTAERGLARALAGVAPPAGDEVLGLLAGGAEDVVALRRRRLAVALAEFDAATITTTHGFCQLVLSGLGVAGDVDADATFLDDPRDLVDEVVDDLYVRRFLRRVPPFDLAEARRIGRVAVLNPDAALEPANADPTTTWAMRWRLATVVRREVDARKRRRKILTYDDLLTRLRDTLGDPTAGPAACTRLRQRYGVVLVDEFQDTDPVQWEIVQRAFGAGSTTLVLIGDPKEAIYAFRGADVHAYLDAARTAGAQATLGVNWRSDQDLVDAYDALFAGTQLGHPRIEYRTVRAAESHQEAGLRHAPHPEAVRVRVVHRDDGNVRLTPQDWVADASCRQHIADDLAADIVHLLSSPTEVVERDIGGVERVASPVRPGHVAVLVAANRHAAVVRDALDAVGVPAVISGAGSVFGAPIARDWLALLEALERPTSPARVRAAALSVFVGWSAQRVATADDAAWEDVYVRVHAWAELLRTRGVATLFEALTHTERMPERLLGRLDGERRLTDLHHVAQLLHREAVAEHLGVTALTSWLRRRIADAADDTADEDRSRRLESDSEAVQVLTIHRSKGLEFPIVYCPYLWLEGYVDERAPPVFHDAGNGDRRTIDVGGPDGPSFDEHQRQHLAEERGEELRLAYVALTRARHQAVVWWASSFGSKRSALARLLFAVQAGMGTGELARAPSEADVLDRLGELAALAPGSIGVERSTGGDGARWTAAPISGATLGVRRFDRGVDAQWRRASYTGITAAAYGLEPASEPEVVGTIDEDGPTGPLAVPTAPDGESERLRAVQLPLAVMAGGARVGSLVHAVLEHTDFRADDLDGALTEQLGHQLGWDRGAVGPAEAVVGGLRLAIETPLGPLVDDVRLRDVGSADRLDELAFELPLVGGDEPAAVLTLDDLAAVLDAHVPAGDPLAGYAGRLRDPALAQLLRGYLTGSLDAVLRVPSVDGGQRFLVVDYKTNWLGADGEDLSAWHYRPDALAAAMQHAHYPLQALFYVVALHRYLRWRLPGYGPDRHLGGALYLFLRGMTGADVPVVGGQPCGVFGWRPSTALVLAVSDLLDRGPGAA